MSQLPLPAGAFIILDTSGSFTEVALTQQDTNLLKVLGQLLQADQESFNSLLAFAISLALNWTTILYRMSHQDKTNPFLSRQPTEGILISLDLAVLLHTKQLCKAPMTFLTN